jgi:O-antigen/teichoic acid export membrane protein
MIRDWGLHEYGEWLILTAIPTYIMLSPDFGLAGAIVNQMAISTAEGNRAKAIILYRTSWFILTGMAICFALIGIFVADWVNWKSVGVTLLEKHAAAIIAWALVQLMLGQQYFLMTGIYRSARRNPRNGLLGSLGFVFYFLIGCIFLALRCDPVTYIAASVVSRALFLGIILIDARRIMPDFTLGIRGISLQAIKPYVVPGLGHAAMPLFNALQNEGMVLVVGAFIGPVSVAIFQTTRTAVNGVKNLAGLVSLAIGLEIPTLLGEGRLNSVRRLLVFNTQATLATAIGCLTVLGLFGGPIFRLWLHNTAVYSMPLVLIMLASMFPFSIAVSFLLFLQATNRIHRAALPLLLAALASLAVTALGCNLFGLNGAAAGLFVYEGLAMIVVCFVAAKHTEIQVRETLAEALSVQSFLGTFKHVLSTSLEEFRQLRSAVSLQTPRI